jgi:hypothetical protein
LVTVGIEGTKSRKAGSDVGLRAGSTKKHEAADGVIESCGEGGDQRIEVLDGAAATSFVPEYHTILQTTRQASPQARPGQAMTSVLQARLSRSTLFS